MPGKKQTDTSHWKDRLDSLADLPGEQLLDKNAAWEKLSGRLDANRRPVKRYWMAAAMLLLVAISWLLIERQKNELVKTRVQPSPDTSIAQSDLPHPVTENENVIVLAPGKPLKVAVPIKQHRPPLYKNLRPAERLHIVTGLAQTDEKTYPQVTIIAPSAEIAPGNLVVPKKKLRVVHINELETAQPEPALATAPGKNNSWLKIKNNASTSSSAAGRQEDIRIKIPLTN